MNSFKLGVAGLLLLTHTTIIYAETAPKSTFSKQNSIIRQAAPAHFPISQSIIIPATATTYYLSGFVPLKQDNDTFGDTKTQTISILNQLQSHLAELDLTLGDIVKMQVFLVADPNHNQRMDFVGFMAGYRQFFGADSEPNTPARSTVEVAGLVDPDFLVEISIIAAKVR